MPIETNLNVTPYFDDFDQNKDFYKVLFRPGVALQARELTQLQTIIQNQIERFGDHVFKSGTIVSGINFQFNEKYDYVKILDNTTDNLPVIPAEYVDLLARNSSNLISKIVNYKSGFQTQDPEMNYLFLKYLNSGDSRNSAAYSNDDVLTVFSDTNKLFSAKVNNGGSGFSNSDSVQITSAIIVNASNITAGANVTQIIGTNTSIAYVTEVNTTFGAITLDGNLYSNTAGYKILKIRPNNSDLSNNSYSSSRWTLQSNVNITQGSNTALVVKAIGSGAKATLVTDGSGIITDVSITSGGSDYLFVPDIRIRSSTGVLNNIDITPLNYKAQITVASSFFNANSTAPVGNGYSFSVTDGIIYQKGHFLRVEPQTIIVNAYSANVHDVSVGFVTEESIVNSNIDSSLLDQAAGTTNFSAPGADRLKLSPSLVVVNTNSVTGNSTFFTLVEFKNGEPFKQNKNTIYNLISKEWERRTSESTGDFVIDPFQMITKDRTGASWSNNYIDLVVDPGLAYVNGKRVRTDRNTYLPVRRSTDTFTSNNNVISVNYGNYVRIKNLGGYFDFKSGATLELYNGAGSYGQVEAGNNNIRTTINPPPGATKIGEAKIRSIVFESGKPGTNNAVYRAYLYDVRVDQGRSFDDVRAIYSNTGIKGTADIVLSTNPITSRLSARILDSKFNSLVFPTGAFAVKSVNNATFTYRTANTGASIQADASVTVSITDVFPYSNNADLNSIQRRDLVLIPHANMSSTNVSTTFTMTNGNTFANQTGGSSITSELAEGDAIQIINSSNTAQTVYTYVVSISNTSHFTIANNYPYTTTANATVQRHFPAGAAISLDDSRVSANVNITRNQITVKLSNSGSFGFSGATDATLIFNANKENTSPLSKQIKRNTFVKLDLSTHSASVEGPWCLGIPDVFRLNKVYLATTSAVNTNSTDVTRYFFIDNGQKNDYYSHAHLVKQNNNDLGLATNNWLLVELDCLDLTSPTAAGIFTVNSYAISFTNDSRNTLGNNFINIMEVPEFVNSKGDVLDLRDSIDFRPRVSNTANITSDLSLTTINPSNTISFGAHDKLFPTPDSEFEYDYDMYLRRADRVIIDTNGELKVLEGVPAVTRVLPPSAPLQTITLGIVDVPPFPSAAKIPDVNLVDFGAKKIGTDAPIFYKVLNYTVDSRVSLGQYDYQPRRFTMRDIGKIERRLQDLEYYTSLSLLEQRTKDLLILSSIDPTVNRFKNGFFVEQFNDYLQADTKSQEFTACIDQENSVMCPQEATYNFQARFNYLDNNTKNNLRNESNTSVEPGQGTWGESVLLLPVVENETVIKQDKFTSAVGSDGTDTKFVGDITVLPRKFKIILNAEIRLTGDDAGPAPPPKDSGGGGGGCCIICTKLFNLGYLPGEMYLADEKFGRWIMKKYPTIYNGYMYWSKTVVEMLDGAGPIDKLALKMGYQKNSLSNLVKKVALFYSDTMARPWGEEMARIMGMDYKGSFTGKFVLYTGAAISGVIGLLGGKKPDRPDSAFKRITVWGILSFFLVLIITTKTVFYPINKLIGSIKKIKGLKWHAQ